MLAGVVQILREKRDAFAAIGVSFIVRTVSTPYKVFKRGMHCFMLFKFCRFVVETLQSPGDAAVFETAGRLSSHPVSCACQFI